MDRILGVDTSADTCSVSLFNRSVWTHFHETLPRQHADRVLGIIQDVLNEQQLVLSDLDAVVYGQGPGSFTGLRISAGIAQGYSLALNLPVFGVSTLTALAMSIEGVPAGTVILPCIDARMSQVYWCPHLVDAAGIPRPIGVETVQDPQSLTVDPAWYRCIAIGNGWQYCDDMPANVLATVLWSEQDSLSQLNDAQQPRAENMIRWVQAVQPKAQMPGSVEPIYIRDNVTWDQKPKIGS